MLILDGKLVSRTRRELLKRRVDALRAQFGRQPHLVVILVGEDPASQVYVRNKVKACAETGIKSTLLTFSGKISQTDLESEIHKLNQDDGVDGILVQSPLPKGLHEEKIIAILSPTKDADGFTFLALGRLFAGQPLVAPCTPQGVMTILEHYNIPLQGKHAVVVGRSNIVGKPMAQLLLMANATVTICHSKTQNLADHTSRADVLVVAAGKPGVIGQHEIKKGAVVIDVGIHGSGQTGAKIVGDVRFDELDGWASAATPVPGGVGPMTITTLLENTVQLFELRHQNK